MTSILHWFAGVILGIEFPVPVYWLVLHGGIAYWRRREGSRLPYFVAVGAAWGAGGWLMYRYLRPQLFAPDRPAWAMVLGAALMLSDIVIFSVAESELGGRRLVGQAELSAKGDLAMRGLYAYVRHPRYLGMILGVLGVCVLAGSPRLWTVAAFWALGTVAMVRIEEGELRRRFGRSWDDYSARVPMLLPLGPLFARK
jgi:protein-S-isoprenylcysteine O-methyltransferase Ste14